MQSSSQAQSIERVWASLEDSSKGGCRCELSRMARWEQQHERDGPWYAIGGVYVDSTKANGQTNGPDRIAKGLGSDSRSAAATKGRT